MVCQKHWLNIASLRKINIVLRDFPSQIPRPLPLEVRQAPVKGLPKALVFWNETRSPKRGGGGGWATIWEKTEQSCIFGVPYAQCALRTTAVHSEILTLQMQGTDPRWSLSNYVNPLLPLLESTAVPAAPRIGRNIPSSKCQSTAGPRVGRNIPLVVCSNTAPVCLFINKF